MADGKESEDELARCDKELAELEERLAALRAKKVMLTAQKQIMYYFDKYVKADAEGAGKVFDAARVERELGPEGDREDFGYDHENVSIGHSEIQASRWGSGGIWIEAHVRLTSPTSAYWRSLYENKGCFK